MIWRGRISARLLCVQVALAKACAEADTARRAEARLQSELGLAQQALRRANMQLAEMRWVVGRLRALPGCPLTQGSASRTWYNAPNGMAA